MGWKKTTSIWLDICFPAIFFLAVRSFSVRFCSVVRLFIYFFEKFRFPLINYFVTALPFYGFYYWCTRLLITIFFSPSIRLLSLSFPFCFIFILCSLEIGDNICNRHVGESNAWWVLLPEYSRQWQANQKDNAKPEQLQQ